MFFCFSVYGDHRDLHVLPHSCPTRRSADPAAASRARPVLNTPLQGKRWRERGKGRPCDVMVDTGMNRLGLSAAQVAEGLLEGLDVDTLHSHLASEIGRAHV